MSQDTSAFPVFSIDDVGLDTPNTNLVILPPSGECLEDVGALDYVPMVSFEDFLSNI
jgi:hypothetical protein